MHGLGPKLTLGLFLFVLALGAATSALVLWGFDRGQDEAGQRSREALELQGRERLATSTRFQADALAQQFAPAADFAQMTARSMENAVAAGVTIPWDETWLESLPGGLLSDTRPGRTTDVIALAPLDAEEARDLRDSAVLDAILPALFADYPGRGLRENSEPIAVFFVSKKLATRYYPPSGALNNSDPDIDVAPLMAAVGPLQNPGRGTYWTDPYIDSAGRGLVMTAYVPAYSGGEFRGAVGVDLLIDRLIAQVDAIRTTDSGFAVYLDKGGNLLRSQGYEAFTRELDGDNAAFTALVAEMREGRDGIGRVTIGGREFFVSYSPLRVVGGSFAQAAPVDELTAEAATIEGSIRDQGDRTVAVILVMMAGLFLCALLGSGWLTRRFLLNPVAELERGTRRVAAGDYESPIVIKSQDELGHLATSFNAMAAEVRKRRTELEDRVRDRTRSLEELVTQRDQRVRELEATAMVASSLTLQHPLEVTLAAVAEQIRAATSVSACAIIAFDEDAAGGHAVLATAGDVPSDASANGHGVMATVPSSTVLPGQSIRAPIVYGERETGLLICWYPDGKAAMPGEVSFVEAIADQVAIAMENADLLARASTSAAIEERQRLARELHDSVSQALYGIGLGARTARRRLGEDAPPSVVEPVDYVLSLAETALTEMRALIFELRPESLEQEGLVAALERQLSAVQARYGIQVERHLSDEPRIALSAKEALYRIAQEGVHNAVKHGRPSLIEVTLMAEGSTAVLTVRDNGSGFDPQGSFPGHLGMRSMTERANKAGAKLQIESAPGNGTTIRVTLNAGPVREHSSGADAD